jgi:hypothetical protein
MTLEKELMMVEEHRQIKKKKIRAGLVLFGS